jgi:hypothetical protein
MNELPSPRAGQPESSPEYPYGVDYEWIASDAVGQVAVFTTGGAGPIPTWVLKNRVLADGGTELLDGLPIRGHHELRIVVPRPDDYIRWANQGLFTYDWTDVHRTAGLIRKYEAFSRPTNAISVAEIPMGLRSLLEGVRFLNLRFSEAPTIDVPAVFQCEPRGLISESLLSAAPPRIL